MQKFECVSNGDAHGWLIVSSVTLARVGKTRSHFSNASLISPSGAIALDHARDAQEFLKAWDAKYCGYEIVPSQRVSADIETWPPFGSKGIDAPAFADTAAFNQAQSA